MDAQDDLVSYYRAELESLRRAGSAFAMRYPKVAAALDLGSAGSADPHVERLIESFAYLTARLQKRMDDRFPEITTALLSVLYPHMVQSVPPMTIVQCTPDTKAGKITSGFHMPRGTRLMASSLDGTTCRFQTSYETTVWPLRVAEAGFMPKSYADFTERRNGVQSVLRLRIEAVDCAMDELEFSSLRFYIHGETQLAGMLYELVLGHTLDVALYDSGTQKATLLPKGSLRPVGFDESDAVIPHGRQAHAAYRILQEYFTLPEKFLFFDLHGLDRRSGSESLELLILLDALPRERMTITPDTFRLGCTPAVNLFTKVSEPIRIDHRRTEYRLVPDQRRERTTEIHSVTTVISSANPQDNEHTVRPFYDFSADGNPATVFWHARQRPSEDVSMPGTETMLSFVDLEFDPSLPPSQTVYAHLLCTNRALVAQLTEGALLQTEHPSPLASVQCLIKPTRTGYAPLGGSSQWALISNLSLNHLSLGEGTSSLAALQKTLRLYSFTDAPSVTRQIEGIATVETRPVLRRVGSSWQGWEQGTQVRLVLDESFYEGVSVFLFASILRQFFALYGSVNSFSELQVETLQKSAVHRFPLMVSGQQRF